MRPQPRPRLPSGSKYTPSFKTTRVPWNKFWLEYLKNYSSKSTFANLPIMSRNLLKYSTHLREVFGNVRESSGSLRKPLGDLLESSEVFKWSSAIFRRYLVTVGMSCNFFVLTSEIIVPCIKFAFFCTDLPLICILCPKNCISLNQLDSRTIYY